jgi:hypothetical protein
MLEKVDPSMREIVAFRIFIKDDYLREGIASKSEREEIIRETGIDDIVMDSSIKLSDLAGQVMILESKDIQKREDALRMVLNQIERIDKSLNNDRSQDIELTTFVPESLVAILMGFKGKMIQKIKEESGI